MQKVSHKFEGLERSFTSRLQLLDENFKETKKSIYLCHMQFL
jgi:hypothetical protein